MKRALLSTLLIAGIAIAGGKKLHPDVAIDDPPTNQIMVRANCVDAEDAAGQVLEALGFKYGSGSSHGNLGRTYYDFRIATRDWKDAAAKVGKSVNLSGGSWMSGMTSGRQRPTSSLRKAGLPIRSTPARCG